jgi:spore germination protein KC
MKSSYKFIFLVTATSLLTSVLTGCWGRLELDDLNLVTLMGVDNGLENKLLVTLVIDLPGKIAGNSNYAKQGEGASIILSAEGESIVSAIQRIERLSARVLTTVHLSTIVLGEEFARTDVGPIMDVFARDLHFRHNTYIAVCKGTAHDFLQNFIPEEEPEPWLAVNKIITTSYIQEGACPNVTIHDFAIGYSIIEQSPWTPYLELASPTARGPSDDDQAQTISNETQRKSTVKVIGSALFALQDGVQKMVGILDPLETMAALLMSGNFVNGYITFALPCGGEPALLFIHHTSVSHDVHVEKEKVSADFNIHITGSIAEIQAKNRDLVEEFKPALIATVEEQINSNMIKTFGKLQKTRSDVIDLGMIVHGAFSTWREWEKFGWHEKFTEVSATFNTHVQIHVFGFIYNPIEPR